MVVAVDAGEGVQEKAQEVFLVKGRFRCVQDKVEDEHNSGMSIVKDHSPGGTNLVGVVGIVKEKADKDDPGDGGEKGRDQ